MKEMVWWLEIKVGTGRSIWVIKEEDDVDEMLREWVRCYWHEVEEGLGPLLEVTDEAVDRYFEAHPDESYDYDQVPLL